MSQFPHMICSFFSFEKKYKFMRFTLYSVPNFYTFHELVACACAYYQSHNCSPFSVWSCFSSLRFAGIGVCRGYVHRSCAEVMCINKYSFCCIPLLLLASTELLKYRLRFSHSNKRSVKWSSKETELLTIAAMYNFLILEVFNWNEY